MLTPVGARYGPLALAHTQLGVVCLVVRHESVRARRAGEELAAHPQSGGVHLEAPGLVEILSGPGCFVAEVLDSGRTGLLDVPDRVRRDRCEVGEELICEP